MGERHHLHLNLCAFLRNHREGWLYLAVVLDLFSRRIVGWSMQASLDRSIVLNALGAALKQRGSAEGILHHSDRGSQYASGEFQTLLSEHDIVCSMSRKGIQAKAAFAALGQRACREFLWDTQTRISASS